MKSKQVLSIEQMQHLQELGLELDYDTLYRYIKFEDSDWILKPFSDLNIIGISFKYIPAYTLQDVLDTLPKDISKDGCTWSASLYIDFENNRIAYGNTDRYGFEVYHEIMIEKDFNEESYTSKIDHLALEPLKKQEVYLGKRKKRGLFQSSVGKLLNADINGAIGIGRKVFGDSYVDEIIDSGLAFNPVRVNIL